MRRVWSVTEDSSLVAAASHLSLLSEAFASFSLSGAWAARRCDEAKKKSAVAASRIKSFVIRNAPSNTSLGKSPMKRRDCMLPGGSSQRESAGFLLEGSSARGLGGGFGFDVCWG